MDRNNLTWVFRGFCLTLLVLALVIVAGPFVVTAQDGGNPNMEALLSLGSGASEGTDHPVGPPPDPAAGRAAAAEDASRLAALISGDVAASSQPAPADDPANPDTPRPKKTGVPSTGVEGQRGGVRGEGGVGAAASGSPLVIPGADFHSNGANPADPRFFFSNGYWYSSGATDCFIAPVYVPNGAQIWQLAASVYDNDPTWSTQVYLYKVYNYNPGTATQLAYAHTTTADTSIQTLVQNLLPEDTVVYPDYAYYVGVCLYTSNHRLYSVRIWYD